MDQSAVLGATLPHVLSHLAHGRPGLRKNATQVVVEEEVVLPLTVLQGSGRTHHVLGGWGIGGWGGRPVDRGWEGRGELGGRGVVEGL